MVKQHSGQAPCLQALSMCCTAMVLVQLHNTVSLKCASYPLAELRVTWCERVTYMVCLQVLHCCRPCALLAADYSLWALLMQIEEVQQQVRQMRRKLPGVDVDALIAQEPMLLRADLPRLMSELARLLPNADPVKFISSNPQMVLGMDAAGMPSTLEIEGMPSTW
eukprot:GHRR01019945.1.p2 GENE.GHRR01019945.1~~GHRR01019945.1.p2  ORF type:complete len:165 (+),score=42.48 GHRR01019945.1:688-1182(+)